MSISSPLKLYHFQAFLIWWHSPFNRRKTFLTESRYKNTKILIIWAVPQPVGGELRHPWGLLGANTATSSPHLCPQYLDPWRGGGGGGGLRGFNSPTCLVGEYGGSTNEYLWIEPIFEPC